MKKISVAVIARNEENRITDSITSIVRAAGKKNRIEIIVIDNASTDETLDAVKNVISNCRTLSNISFRLIHLNENNLGLARQIAVEECESEYLAFTDADCIVGEDWLDFYFSKIDSCFENDAEIIGIGSGNLPGGQGNWQKAIQGFLKIPYISLGSIQAVCPSDELKLSHVPTCNIVFHLARLKKVGGFCPDFNFVCEDLELSFRANKANKRYLYVPSNEVIHIHSNSLWSWAAKMFRYGFGQCLVAKKHPEIIATKKVIPFFLLTIFLITTVLMPKLAATLAMIYFASTIFAVLIFCKNLLPVAHWWKIPLIVITTHFFYAAGELAGAFHLIFSWRLFQMQKASNAVEAE